MKICTKCVLPEAFPGIKFNEDGVCNFCLRYKGEADIEAKKHAILKRFEALVEEVRNRSGYHCMLAYSGGKDSTYTLKLLRERYDLRVLAVTLDNGFISPQAFVNINHIVEAVNADFLLIKPRLDLLKEIFIGVSGDKSPYPMKALERASSTCNACIGLIKNVTTRIAVEQDIPMMAFGWSPGQAPISASLFKMSIAMLRQMHDTRSGPLREIAGDDVAPYLLQERHFDGLTQCPHNVNPLAFHDYHEETILKEITKLGWVAPKDTDGNSSNCLLNTYANRLHLEKFKFHPYAFEVAGLVRAGAMTRDQGLVSLADLGTEEILKTVETRLGLRDR